MASPQKSIRGTQRTCAVLLLIGAALAAWTCKQAPVANAPREAALRPLTDVLAKRLHAALGMRRKDFAALPPEARRRVLWRLHNPDTERDRLRFLLVEAAGNRTGSAPRGALLTALQQLRTLRLDMAKSGRRATLAGLEVPHRAVLARGAASPPTAGITGSSPGWISIGPENVGGRTRSLVIDPDHPARLWAGSVAGGVWNWDEKQQRFVPNDDLMANLAISSLAMVPDRHDIVYAGTGEGYGNLDAILGGGLYRKVGDGGWQLVAGTDDDRFRTINRIAVSKDGRTLLVAASGGLIRGTLASADASAVAFDPEPVLKGSVSCVLFAPGNDSLAIAGDLENGAAHYSTDGGRSWFIASHPEAWSGRVELTYAAADPAIVYASVSVAVPDPSAPPRNGEVWRSSDSGQSFSSMHSKELPGDPEDTDPPSYLGDSGWYANAIWAGDPKDPNLVLVGGLDLWRSTDGGTGLVRISTWSVQNSVHGDQHAIVSHPDFGKTVDGKINRTVFFGNDGGVYKTDDIDRVCADPPACEKGWVSLNDHYVVAQFYGGAADSAGTVVGGTQDAGTVSLSASARDRRWASVLDGDGGPTFLASNGSGECVFGEYIYLKIFRKCSGDKDPEYINGAYVDSDGVEKWKALGYQIPDSAMSFASQDANAPKYALFIAPFVVDPNDNRRILAGGRSLWRTNDAMTPNDLVRLTGPSWHEIKAPLEDNQFISALAVAKRDMDRVWVGYDGGALFTASDATKERPKWTRIGGGPEGALPSGRMITSIVIDPADTKTVYLTFGGASRHNVWKTPDEGATWQDIGASLPASPARTLTVHPQRREYVYLGTDVGLFASEDAGAHWGAHAKRNPEQEGPNTAPIYGLFWIGNDLVAATHGRGMFRRPIAVTSGP